MKAVILNGFGDANVLEIKEVEKPKPKDNQVLIKVLATSVNRADIVQRQGNYPPPPGESDILGLEVAGTIEELGSNVKGFQIGDKVMSLIGGGGYAEYALAYSDHLIKIPESMSFEEAACVCEAYITAYLNIFILGNLKDFGIALVHGGGGGVNTAAIQICKKLTPNAKLVVTSSQSKIEFVKKLGADFVIDYRENPEFSKIVKTITNSRGVDVILDHIGAKYLEQNMKSLAYGGKLVIIGLMGGIKTEINLGLLMVKRQNIIGSVIRSRSVKEKADIIEQFTKDVMPLFNNRGIVPSIYKVFNLSDVKKAHMEMEKSKHLGKIVLKVI